MVRWQISAILAGATAVVLTVAALFAETGAIERDLGSRSARVLSGEATSWASARIEGRDAILTGKAPSEDLLILAITRLERLYGVRAVDASAAGLLPLASPYFVSLVRDGDRLVMKGDAPSLPDKARIVSFVRHAASGLTYVDELELARGMPAAFLDALRTLYPVVALLRHGNATLRDDTVTVSGEAVSNAAYDRLRAMSFPLPAPYRVERFAVTRPVASPYVWSATRDEGGAVVLAGFVPDPETRKSLADAVGGAVRRAPVSDGSDFAAGAPEGFAATAATAVDCLGLFAEGKIAFVDKDITVSGRAATPEAYRVLLARLAAWAPTGYAVHSRVDLPIVAPYTLTASRLAGAIVVSGFVPDGATRQSVKASAGPGAVVETTLAAGAPAGFVDAEGFALDLLSRLERGTALIVDRDIRVDGIAMSSDDLRALEAAAAAPPEGYAVTLDVTPPFAFTFSVARSAEAVAIGGAVADAAMKAAVLETARRAFGKGLRFEENLVETPALPASVGPVLRATVEAVSRLASGKAILVPGRLEVAGTAFTAVAAARYADEVMALLPKGTRLVAKVDAAPPEAPQDATSCAAAFGRLMADNGILFLRGAATVADVSRGFVDRLAAEAIACPSTQLEIDGFADSGADEALGEARARTVAGIFENAGVAPARLRAAGAGFAGPATVPMPRIRITPSPLP